MKTISQVKPKEKRPRTSWKNLKAVFKCAARDLRLKHGLTLRDISGSTKLSTATIQRMEQGYNCDLDHALVLASFFETSVEKLFVPLRNGAK